MRWCLETYRNGHKDVHCFLIKTIVKKIQFDVIDSFEVKVTEIIKSLLQMHVLGKMFKYIWYLQCKTYK